MMPDSHTPPPVPAQRPLGDSGRRLALFGIWVGSIVLLGPVWGMIATVLGMTSTFQEITVYGSGDSRELSHGISASLVSTEIGILVAPIGLCILIVSIIVLRKYAEKIKTANQALQTTPMTRSEI
jgi:biopolymer transport protein ExbB/TolQ